MKLMSAQLFWHFFLILYLLPPAYADLNSDKRALLAFAANVPHGPKLNWSNATDICTSWVGITCSPDRTHVLMVRLPAVGLTGPIPSNTVGELDALRVLSLRSNHLNGTLPSDLLSLPSLRSLFLQHNNFSSNIPKFFPHRLHILDLSFNSFKGDIPSSIQLLKRLTGLYLQSNSLSGPIPNIPFSKLKHLNLSYNDLNGSIPSSLKAFPHSSFSGNPLLCGLPLKPCTTHTPPPPSSKEFPIWAILAITVGVGGALVLLIFLFVYCCLRRLDSEEHEVVHSGKSITKSGDRGKKPRIELGGGVIDPANNKLVFFQGCPFSFDVDDLLTADAEMIGKGKFGTTYRAVMEETTVVVKRLREVALRKQEFEQQIGFIEIVGQHQNVVPIRAYYYTNEEKLLVYDYFPAGSLMSQLHGNSGGVILPLDWDTRLKIALGAARGIAHIHTTGGPRFCHGSLKASNILINEDMEGCITDYNLLPLMKPPPVPSLIPPGGYRAPEVYSTQKHSHKSDVYSFGVILLELLTGKQPIQSPRRDNMVDLPRWVQAVVMEEWTNEVFDESLMRYHNGIEDEMVQVLQIGLSCVVPVPENRPTIDEVVRRLERVRVYDNRPPSD